MEDTNGESLWRARIGSDHVSVVESFAQLHSALSGLAFGYEGIGCIFRGHSNPSWKLAPKVGRGDFADANFAVYLEEWKAQAIAFIEDRPESELEWLAIAQHHGLATNLLDWTYNPLTAAFFAVREPSATDAVIVAYLPDSLLMPSVSPWQFNGVLLYKPYHVVARMSRQMAVFSVHNPATLALDEIAEEANKLRAIVIRRSYRRQLLHDLAAYGITDASLFPDLDGLSRHINWKMLDYEVPGSL